MASDLDQLIEMGFDKERAQLAVTKTGGLQGALQWLEDNQDKSLEEIQAQSQPVDDEESPALQPGEQPRSLVCNDCGKKFRGQSQAEFHASKSGHVDFAESTEEIAPLTDEQKKERLAELREKLAAKRAGLSEQDKIDKKRNEPRKEKEKQDEIEAKKRIKAKIEADKEERRLKAEQQRAERAGLAPPQPVTAPVPTSSGPTTSKPASAYTETRLRFQSAQGNIMKTLPVETTLFEVAAALRSQDGIEVESFMQNFPRKVFNSEFFGETLKELGLVPSASLVIQ
ncbi:Ubiquitin-associated/translation elongation factor EF1B N-terminal eukaryote [Penicillium paradoxum]|uniref:Ubiquitin-associated/translation elongation factor EF1B N-terminal eukaryote n=1 Tax=Penicillium paradoxum TaxID=176176 RepID=UPI002547CF57|nr:Ubiquitin-associated/translation elongation factor EF1B N-terminal eukaryote [Penicillium paradoxum]KAJ5787249.1 Ubiquitin-associated/translation elongation factor EF1B N-terminal eukaryote [Penicillium paradoxum]